MTKQTKTIEDYLELDGFIGDNEYGDAIGNSVISSKLVVTKLLEQQAKIDSLTEDKAKLIEVTRSADFKELTALRSENKRLTEQNKELQGSVRVLEVMLKPDGYTTDEEHYHTPEDYVGGCLTVDSKVGEQFTITPYTLLPEETYEITKLDDSTFEIELVELNKESK